MKLNASIVPPGEREQIRNKTFRLQRITNRIGANGYIDKSAVRHFSAEWGKWEVKSEK